MKLMIVDGDADSNWVAPDEEFEKVDSDPEQTEAVQEESKESPEEGKKGKRGGPWKKHWKQMKAMKSQCMNKMFGLLRTVIREEIGYALNKETPPPVEEMEMNFDDTGLFKMMRMGMKGMGPMGPGMMGPGHCKPKF